MSPEEFLSLFWPHGTCNHTTITTINPYVKQDWQPTIGRYEGAHNAYFSPAMFSMDKRTKDYAIGAKALWLDLDVKDGHHESVDALQIAVNQFIDGFNLPFPLLVRSGAGIHLYFLCQDVIPTAAWVQMAAGLRGVCDEAGLVVDHKRTQDIASLMRLPGTVNIKKGRAPLDVEVIEDPDRPFAISTEATLERILKAYMPAKIKPIAKLAPQYQAMADLEIYPPHQGGRYDANVAASKCQQLGRIRSSGGNVSEPLWFATLQLLVHSEDADRLAWEWSSGYPGASQGEVAQKMEQLRKRRVGPSTCEHFERDGDKKACRACPYHGKIKGPLTLGLKRFDPETQERVPQTVAERLSGYSPDIPEPYYLDTSGAVMMDSGETDTAIIHPYPIFVHRRFRESDAQWYFSVVCMLPRDGIREIRLSAETLANHKSFYSELAAAGILSHDMATDKRDLFTYIYRCAEQIWTTREVVNFYEHYGWDSTHTTFSLGVSHYTKDGIRSGEFKEDAAPTVPPEGHSVVPWRYVVAHYMDAPIAFRLAFFASFASPLLYMTGLNGALYSLFSPMSGVGKTTVLSCATAVWGDPEYFTKRNSDTLNSLLNFAGVAHSIPVCVDEFSCAKVEDFQQFVYELSGGKERARLTKEIKQRKGGQWEALFMASTNSALTSQLPVGDNFEGISARLIEAQVFEYTTPQELAKVNGIMRNNWGVLGHIWAQHMVENQERIAADVQKIFTTVQARRPGSYRYYAAFISTVLVSMREVGKMLGMHMGIGKETLEDFIKLFIPGVIMAQGYQGGAGARGAAHITTSYHTKVLQRVVSDAFNAGKYQYIQSDERTRTMAALGAPTHAYTVLEDKDYLVVAESLSATLRATMPEHMERVHILPGGAYTTDTRMGVPAYRISKAAVAGLSVVAPRKLPQEETA